MGAENFVTAPAAAAGKRQAKRARVLLAAKLKTSTGELDVRLRDLSRKGALIECKAILPVDSDVTFMRGPLSVPARVAWVAPGKAGLEFTREIDEQDVLVQLGRSARRAPAPNPYEPVVGQPVLRDSQELARRWGVQVGIALTDADFKVK